MTEAESRAVERIADAVELQGRELAEVRGDVKAIRQWTHDRKATCDRHEREIVDLQKGQNDQRDRITRGLTWQALLSGLISALVVALAIGVPLWIKVSAGMASRAGGG